MLVYWKQRLLLDAWMLAVSMRKARVLESAAAGQQVLAAATLIVYYFMTCVVEHMVRCFAIFVASSFSFKFLGHFVVFAVFCKMSYVFATNDAIGYSLGSSSSSAFTSATVSSSSSPAAWGLIKTYVLLVRWRPLETLFC
jgi:tryptophan synthase beta subunit